MRSAASRPLVTSPTCCPILRTAFASEPAVLTASSDRNSWQRHQLRADEHEVRLGADAVTAVQAEQVAALQHQRAELEVAARLELELVEEGGLPAAANHGDLHPLLAYLDPRVVLHQRPRRQH